MADRQRLQRGRSGGADSSRRPRDSADIPEAQTLAILRRLPLRFWCEPRWDALPAALRDALDRADPPLLRAVLVDVVHRLTQTEEEQGDDPLAVDDCG